MTKRDAFRELFGDELADQVERLKRKGSGVEVLKPKHKPARNAEHKSAQTSSLPDEQDRWWNR